MNMHAQALRGSDGHLIRLCTRTIEAQHADLAAGESKAEAQTLYEGQAPAYPVLPNGWRYSRSETASHKLRWIVRKNRADATPNWLRSMRALIKAVVAWERQCSELRKSTGFRSAEIRKSRTNDRVFALVEQVIETPATTAYGVAWKASVVRSLRKSGRGQDHRVTEFLGVKVDELVCVILDEISVIGATNDNRGRITSSRGYPYTIVEREAPEMADAA